MVRTPLAVPGAGATEGHGSFRLRLEQFMSNIEFPLTSPAALDRKAKVEALLDRYLEGLDLRGALERAKGMSRDIAAKN